MMIGENLECAQSSCTMMILQGFAQILRTAAPTKVFEPAPAEAAHEPPIRMAKSWLLPLLPGFEATAAPAPSAFHLVDGDVRRNGP